MQFTIGQTVTSSEHPNSIGTIERITPTGELVILWTTAPNATLPYGHQNREIWPASDHHLLAPLS